MGSERVNSLLSLDVLLMIDSLGDRRMWRFRTTGSTISIPMHQNELIRQSCCGFSGAVTRMLSLTKARVLPSGCSRMTSVPDHASPHLLARMIHGGSWRDHIPREADHVRREASESRTRYALQALPLSPFTHNIQRQFQVSGLSFHVFG